MTQKQISSTKEPRTNSRCFTYNIKKEMCPDVSLKDHESESAACGDSSDSLCTDMAAQNTPYWLGTIFTANHSRRKAICERLVNVFVLTTVGLWKQSGFVSLKQTNKLQHQIKWKDLTLLSVLQARKTKVKCSYYSSISLNILRNN